VLLVLLLKEANEIALKKSRENEGLIEKLKRNLANREQQIEVRQVIVALLRHLCEISCFQIKYLRILGIDFLSGKCPFLQIVPCNSIVMLSWSGRCSSNLGHNLRCDRSPSAS
jgi:hypothetical protein